MGYMDNETTQTNLYDRVSKLLESYEWSDCSFTVSGQYFKAHRLILGISSPVFKAMFYGPLSSNDDIKISDIEPDIFQLMINYVYTDKVEISSLEQAFELLYAAKKYLLEYLMHQCIHYIETNLSVDNVISVLAFSEFIQEKTLLSYSLKLFCEHAEYLLNANIDKLTCACLKLILECDKINVSEKNLIKFAFNWSKSYCNINNVPDTIENRKRVLVDEGLWHLLRFPVLNEEDLDEILKIDNNLLQASEVEILKKTMITYDDVSERNNIFKAIGSRDSLKVRLYICHRSSVRSAAPLIIDQNNNSVSVRIKVDKTVFVNSLSVPTRMSPEINFHSVNLLSYSEQFSVTVIRESNNSVIKFTNFMNTVEYDANVFVDFSEPCVFIKDEWYCVKFAWPRNRYYSYKYIVSHRDYASTQKAKFQFEDVFMDTTTDGSFLESLKFSL